MAKKQLKIKVDTINGLNKPEGTIKQLDSVLFNIEVTEEGEKKDLTGQTIKLFARKSDGKMVEQSSGISITNAEQGELTIDLLNAAVQTPGYVYFELEISDSNGIISTADFVYRVIPKVGSDEAIESTNEVATLKEIEIYVAQAKVELQRFKELQTEMLRTNEIINSNEEGRVSAEEKRVNSENKRALAEEERGTLFTQKEEERGTLFAQKEVERDDTFAQGERERNERFEEAESDRAVAESERVIAEQVREEKFAGFESKISSNTKELKAARSASTGEKFNSLDERIDHEVDRLNKKIDVTMLQQEDKENHTIENTVNGMTTDMVIKGRTLQNLWDIETTDGFYMANLDNGYYVENSKNFACLPNTKYTVIYNEKIPTDNNASVLYKDVNGIHISEGANCRNGQIVTFTTPSNCYYLYTRGFRNNVPHSVSGNGFNFIIVEGELKESVNYFEGIKSFGQQENKISILSSGKNLFDLDGIAKNFNYKEIKDGFEIYNTADFPYPYANIKKRMFLKKGTYTFSYSGEGTGFVNIAVRSTVDDTSYSGDVKPNIPKTFTLDTDKEVFVTFYLQGNVTTGVYKNKYTHIQIVEGSQNLSYEPYQQDKKDILIKEPLRSVGDIQDIMYEDNGQVKVNRYTRQYTFTGNESIRTFGLTDETTELGFEFLDFKLGFKPVNNNFPNAISNRFRVYASVYAGSSYEGIALNQNGNTYIRISKDKLSTPDVEGFKAWLKENPTTIYYELAEPVETPLDENINVKTFGEKTYVSFENSISGTSSFKAPVDTTATITRLNRENRALEEENRSLRQDFESTTLTLIDSDLELIKQNVDMDFRLMEVEFALDIPQAILSSNINFKNKKGEVKSMARSPYEMMKIVILSGDYDREDYMHKVGKYYERGRMTKEEHDELMSLMTADEVISK